MKRRIGARGSSAPRSARKAEPIGCLILTVSRSSLNAVTWDLVLRNLLLMLASFVVVVLVIHFFFLRAVRRPVKEMIRVMRVGGKRAARRAGAAAELGRDWIAGRPPEPHAAAHREFQQ